MPFIPDPNIDARFPYDMECQLCGKEAGDVMPESLNGVTNHLVRMQEHLMSVHGAEQTEFAQHTQRRVQNVVTKEWTWYFIRPDGTEWLKAKLRRKYLNEPNPVTEVHFHFKQGGPPLRWRLERPWDQGAAFAEIGVLGAKYAIGIDLDLPPAIRHPDDIELAHDCLAAFVLGESPYELPEEVRTQLEPVKAATAALDVLCWILGHDHNPNFQRNLDELQWRDMVKKEKGDDDAEGI